jgi:hypothetical protein
MARSQAGRRMSRQTRFEFLATIIKRSRRSRSRMFGFRSMGRRLSTWNYAAPLPGVAGWVKAPTRSEARAEIKKAHGLKTTAGIGLVLTCIRRQAA